MKTETESLPEFAKDLKKLGKKYRNILLDFDLFEKALFSKLPEHLPGTEQISNLGSSVSVPIYKVKKFRCRDLKGCGVKSGIRIIYAYLQNENKITYLEIYHKNKKSNHDSDRIKLHFMNK